MSKNILVIGGLGFIGYHVVKILQENGYKVVVGSRSRMESDHTDAPIINIDLERMDDQELSSAVKPFQIIVFAGGVDDRNIHDLKLKDYFIKGNVDPCLRLANMSKEHDGIEQIIILGSYFSYFDRERPEWHMSEIHPYVKSRLKQRLETKKAAGDNIQVSCLEIPYVFGSAPGLTPLWKPLINYIATIPIVFYTAGGTNICAVEQVAGAVLGIIQAPQYRKHWIVGGENVSWKKMIHMMARAMGKRRWVVTIPNFLTLVAGSIIKLYLRILGKASGLDPYHFVKTQTSCTYLDTEESMRLLGYKKMNLQVSIDQTVEACGKAKTS